MKVLLIYPPTEYASSGIDSGSPGVSWSAISVRPPLGLMYIASVLEEDDIKVEILDCIASGWKTQEVTPDGALHVGLSHEQIQGEVQRFKPDLIGISALFTCQMHVVHEVAKRVKEVDPTVPVVVGGIHPTVLPRETLENSSIDFVVTGEGEFVTLELIKAIEGEKMMADINGVAYRSAGKTIVNPPSPLIKDLDSLPFPARHLLPMDEYTSCLTEKPPDTPLVRPSMRGLMKRLPWTNMLSSRGCPYKCVFCAVHLLSGGKWRARSAENVVDEIEHVVEKYGTKTIQFEDDNLTLDKKRTRRICEEILDRNLDIDWECFGVAVRHLDKDLLQAMRKSGCVKISLGIESGNPRILEEVINKPLKLDEARQVIKWAKEAGITTKGFFIIGMPGEDESTIRDTINFAKSSGLDSADFVPAMPFPGTKLFEIVKGKGYLKELEWSDYWMPNMVFETEQLSSEDVQEWVARASLEFKRRPSYGLYRFRRVRSVPELIHLIRQAAKLTLA